MAPVLLRLYYYFIFFRHREVKTRLSNTPEMFLFSLIPEAQAV
jgi:hypothetical protein